MYDFIDILTNTFAKSLNVNLQGWRKSIGEQGRMLYVEVSIFVYKNLIILS